MCECACVCVNDRERVRVRACTCAQDGRFVDVCKCERVRAIMHAKPSER